MKIRTRLAAFVCLAMVTAIASMAFGQYSQVPLDMSGAFNMDSVCGPREFQQCRLDGTQDHGQLYGGLLEGNGAEISNSQGQAIVANASNPAWAYTIETDYNHPLYLTVGDAFPADGVLTGADRSYHLPGLTGNTTLAGDWTESANPALFDLKPNMIVTGSTHNRASWQIASVTVDLPADQQDYYDDINFVLNGFYANRARNMSIVAIYGDGSESVLYAFATDVADGPVMNDPASTGADFSIVAASTYHYSVTSGSTGSVRTLTNGLSYFEFASPLPLDNTRLLTGLRFEDVNPALNWASRGLAIWGATATRTDLSANAAPVADAGSDQLVTDSDEDGFEVVYLDATASYDGDGRIISVVWSEAGDEIATGLTPVLTMGQGAHTVVLTVTDNRGATDTDTVLVDISLPGPGHPIAEAGPDQTLLDANNSGDEQVVLDGSGSYDPDGQIVEYDWSENGVSLAAGVNPTVTLPVGTHAIRLTVTDDEGKVRYDTVTVRILDWREPATYHVAVDGDDANDGSEASPWATLAHAVGQVSFGDTIVMHEGIYRGGVELPVSGLPGYPITIRAADGERPVISGARELSGWTPCASAAEAYGNADWASIYYVDIDWKPAMIFQDDLPLAVSRTTGWRHPADGGTGATLYDPVNITEPSGYWVGAELFIWFRSGTTHAHKQIVAQTGSTLTLDSDFGYSRTPDAEDFYWLENKVELIDASGQFATVDNGDGTYRLFVRPLDGADPAACLMEGSTSDASFLISWNSRGYWVFDGLELRHSENHAVGSWIAGGHHITVRNCQVHHNGGTGIYSRYNDGGVIEYNYCGYNGNGATTGSSSDILVLHNEIGDNWYDGLIVTGPNSTVRENYVHGHFFWGHPDNIQTYGEADNILFDRNLLFNGGQQIMMESTNGVTLTNNMILFNRAYAVICGHDTTFDITMTGNTIAWPQYSAVNTSGGFNYDVHDNVFGTGMSYRDTGTLAYDYNLYWTGGSETIFNHSGSWGLTLADITSRTGQEANSQVADPMFTNVPTYWVFPNTDNLTLNTTTRAYMDVDDMAAFEVGDYIELDMDGIVRIVTAVGPDWVEWDVPEPRALIRVTAIANWKDNPDFTLDMSYADGSAAIGAASDGGDLGSDIDVQQFLASDFDGDGTMDVPRWGGAYTEPVRKPGDANGDGQVDIQDFVVLKQNYGRSGALWSEGDFNGDGNVDIQDFVILKQNYGS